MDKRVDSTGYLISGVPDIRASCLVYTGLFQRPAAIVKRCAAGALKSPDHQLHLH
ncbi:hypothetical protein CBL_04213 [Carabus blaptoides fortunei]